MKNMSKIDPTICEYFIAYLDARCLVTGMICNPNHPDCEYADERDLGINEELWNEPK